MKILFIILGMCLVVGTKAQNLDRLTISAGGSATDKVSYTIGETFNLSMAKDGDVKFETGMQGSISNTGSDNNFLKIENTIANNVKLACYPNPAKDFIYFSFGKQTAKKLFISIVDINGKIVFAETTTHTAMMDCNIEKLEAGSYILSIRSENEQAVGSVKFVKQ